MNSPEELATYIQEKAANSSRYVIAISGFGGSGKSTTSDRLAQLLGDAIIIHVDDFIAADENGAHEGYLHDWQKLEELIFQPAKTADELVSRIYDWDSNSQVYETTQAGKYIIIEGSAGLIQDKYRDYFDLTIWLDVPQEIANARGKKRDKESYHVDHDDLWDNVWGPLEHEGFAKLRPDEKADILLRNN